MVAGVVLAVLYMFGSSFGLFDISVNTTSNGLWVVPVVGLVVPVAVAVDVMTLLRPFAETMAAMAAEYADTFETSV